MLISIFALFNGILGLIRVNLIFSRYESGEYSFPVYLVAYCLESICFFGAIWFFSIKYYETASDLKLMLVSSPDITP